MPADPETISALATNAARIEAVDQKIDSIHTAIQSKRAEDAAVRSRIEDRIERGIEESRKATDAALRATESTSVQLKTFIEHTDEQFRVVHRRIDSAGAHRKEIEGQVQAARVGIWKWLAVGVGGGGVGATLAKLLGIKTGSQ